MILFQLRPTRQPEIEFLLIRFFESTVNEKIDGDHCGVAIVHFQVQGKLGWEPKGVLGGPKIGTTRF